MNVTTVPQPDAVSLRCDGRGGRSFGLHYSTPDFAMLPSLSSLALAATVTALSVVPAVDGPAPTDDPLIGPFTFGTWIQPVFEVQSWSDEDTTVGFRLRRARFIFGGEGLDGSLRFRLMPDLGSTPQLRDAWVQIQTGDHWIRMGQQTVPFHLQREVSMARGHFGDRALAARRFELSGGRDIGITAGTSGLDGRLRVAAGAYNGRGANRKDPSPFPLLAARVNLAMGGSVPNGETDLARTPTPVVTMSAGMMGSRESFLRPRPGFAADQTRDWRAWTLDLHGRYRGVSVSAAWLAHSLSGPSGAADPTVQVDGSGWYLGGGFVLPPTGWAFAPDVEVTVRHSRATWDRDRDGSAEEETSLGLTLFHRQHGLQTRFQLSRESGPITGSSDTGTRFTLEHQLLL